MKRTLCGLGVLWGWSFLGWGLFCAFFALQLILGFQVPGRESLQRVAAFWVVWPFLTPLLYLLTERLPLGSSPWVRSLPAHLGAAVVAFGVAEVAQERLYPKPPSKYGLPAEAHTQEAASIDGKMATGRLLPKTLPSLGEHPREHGLRPRHQLTREQRRLFFPVHHAVVLLGIVAGSHAMVFYRKAIRKERQANELQMMLREAQLQRLSMQLQPHFLFNALNSVAALMHDDVQQADEMILALSDFLRLTLSLPETQEVRLRSELEYARRYLAIEKVRLAGRLSVEEKIGEEVLDAMVPTLILQPLLENAFRHAFHKTNGACLLQITALREGEDLCVQVRDNGMGVEGELMEGTGIRNCRERLQALYGEKASLEVRSEAGCTVRLRIPFHQNAL